MERVRAQALDLEPFPTDTCEPNFAASKLMVGPQGLSRSHVQRQPHLRVHLAGVTCDRGKGVQGCARVYSLSRTVTWTTFPGSVCGEKTSKQAGPK